MTVEEVLLQAGRDTGRRGRTRCPLHDGGNATSFSYSPRGWYCFACGAGGSAWTLAQTLGVLPERVGKQFVVGGLEALNQAGSGYAPSFATSARECLTTLASERQNARLDGITEELSYASFLVRSGGELYRLVMTHCNGPLGSSFAALDAAADAVWVGLALEEAVNSRNSEWG